MNKAFRRLLSIICLVLLTVSLTAGPLWADPTDTPTGPPVSNVVVAGTATVPTPPTPPTLPPQCPTCQMSLTWD